jgi:hypothetical protein
MDSMTQYYETAIIGGKNVYIVEAHHFALFPWAEIRRNLRVAPTLITLDHHTDTMDAFRVHCAVKSNGNSEVSKAMLENLTASIDWKSDETLRPTVNALRHDEHIHAAFLSGIISIAFAINLSDQTPSIEQINHRAAIATRYAERLNRAKQGQCLGSDLEFPPLASPEPPYTYNRPDNGMFTIHSICSIGCEKLPHDDDCVIARDNEVLESIFLDHGLATAKCMAESVGMESAEASPYILDIDLDYFHSSEAINPQNPSTFYRLIRNAVAITVARESKCVDDLRHEDSDVTANSLLERLLRHIEDAIANDASRN